MENFVFSNKTKIIFGRGVEDQVGLETAKCSKRILVHHAGGSVVRSGLLSRVLESLRKAGVSFVELSGVKPNPRLSLVREGIALCRSQGLDFILAVGGGSVIDSAKAIAVGVLYDGDVWDFYDGKASPAKALGVGTVLTIPAAGSEASTGSVITDEERALKRACDSVIMRPVFSLLDPELTYTLPPYQTACGLVDMAAHIMERYFTTVRNVEVTDGMAEALLRTIIRNGPIVIAEPENYAARAEIMWSGTLAHNDMLGTGRVGDWATHDIEHEISAIYDLAHGAGLAIVFPAWMLYNYKRDVNRFARYASEVWGVKGAFDDPERAALDGIARLKAFNRSIGMPVSLADAGIPAGRIPEMADKCTRGDTTTVGRFQTLRRADVEAILRLAAV